MGKNDPVLYSEAFRNWLKKKTELGDRSVSDVVSRAKRVATFLDVTEPTSNEDLAYELGKVEEFTNCAVTVRSQLKRAAILYREFLDNQPKKGRGAR